MVKLIALLSCLPLGAAAWQDTNDPPTASSCDSTEHRQFDFWAGEWDVTQNGQPAGHNRIEIIENGCALAEHWTSAQAGFTGTSLNAWNASSGQWHQTWMDSSGTVLHLDGGLVDGKMVMSGQRKDANGTLFTDRITWTQNDDGSVRQHWESSPDGHTWATVFDGHYVRVKGKP